MKKISILILFTAYLGTGISKAQYADLFDFNGANGAYPSGGLTLSGNVMYGMTNQGGINDNGTIFSINTDGTGHSVLFNFNGINGKWPGGALTLSPSAGVLYGMTGGGGTDSAGTIFSINTNGTGYMTLLNFNGTNGFGPQGSLILDGGVLYGMTSIGGNLALNSGLGYGTVFSINTDGTGYNKLHDFDGTNGRNPSGNLILSGNVLYGMSRLGGANGHGTIFSINTNGTAFNTLFFFNGTNGSDPKGSLTLSGNVLYGATMSGGANFLDGTIFSINTDGTGFINLHNFDGTAGKNPLGRLELIGNVLYGAAYNGGANDKGILFSINTNGSGFVNFHNFNVTNNYNHHPLGYFTLSSGKLYGMAGGGANGYGVAFSFNLGINTQVNELGNTTTLDVFPNPASNTVTINFSSSTIDDLSVTIKNGLGRTVYSENKKDFSGEYVNTINLTNHPKGIYFVEIAVGSEITSKKIILE